MPIFYGSGNSKERKAVSGHAKNEHKTVIWPNFDAEKPKEGGQIYDGEMRLGTLLEQTMQMWSARITSLAHLAFRRDPCDPY